MHLLQKTYIHFSQYSKSVIEFNIQEKMWEIWIFGIIIKRANTSFKWNFYNKLWKMRFLNHVQEWFYLRSTFEIWVKNIKFFTIFLNFHREMNCWKIEIARVMRAMSAMKFDVHLMIFSFYREYKTLEYII